MKEDSVDLGPCVWGPFFARARLGQGACENVRGQAKGPRCFSPQKARTVREGKRGTSLPPLPLFGAGAMKFGRSLQPLEVKGNRNQGGRCAACPDRWPPKQRADQGLRGDGALGTAPFACGTTWRRAKCERRCAISQNIGFRFLSRKPSRIPGPLFVTNQRRGLVFGSARRSRKQGHFSQLFS